MQHLIQTPTQHTGPHGMQGCTWGEQGYACVWSLERPAEPEAVLLSEGQPAACCLHSQAKLACIGMSTAVALVLTGLPHTFCWC